MRPLRLSLPLLSLLCACARATACHRFRPPARRYRLGPGDTVRLITYGEDALTGDFRVADAGTIAVPLLGGVRAAGLTPAELGQSVADLLVRTRNCCRTPRSRRR